MKMSFNAKSNDRRRAAGFTLVEMLVVIGIILVLLAMLLPAINYMRRQSDRKNQQADFQTIGAALDEYKKDHGDYPRPSAAQPTMPVLAWALVGSPEKNHPLRNPGPSQADQWDGNPGPGFRTMWNTTTQTGSKVWGPYVDPDKFIKSSADFPNDNKLHFLDRFGGPIEYFPRWRLLPRNTNANLFGTVNVPQNNFYDYRQMYREDPGNFPPDGKTNAPDNTTPLHYLRRALGDWDLNDKIDGVDKKTEVWRDTPPYILLSRGPLRKFTARSELIHDPSTPESLNKDRFSKALEISNLGDR